MPVVVVSCQALLVVVFLAAVGGKLWGPGAFADFRDSLVRMRLVGPAAAPAVAVLAVVAELAVVVLLVLPTGTGPGLWSAAVVLAALTVGVTVALRRGAAVPCRCFGRSARRLDRRHLLRNALLLAVALVGGLAGGVGPGSPAMLGTAELPVLVLAAGLGAAAAVPVLAWDALAELVAPMPVGPTPAGPRPTGLTPTGLTPTGLTPTGLTPTGLTPTSPTPTSPTPTAPRPAAPTRRP